MENPAPTYETTDLNVAAALWAAGAELVRINPISHRTVGFVLSPLLLCEDLSNQFRMGTLTVNAKNFADRQRSLKDILFAKLRDGNGETKWKETNRPARRE